MQLLGGLNGLLGCCVFDERISECRSVNILRCSPNRAVPFCDIVLAQGHEDRIFFRLPHGVELLQKKFDQLFFACLRDLRQSIDNDESIQTLFHSDIIVLSEICGAPSVLDAEGGGRFINLKSQVPLPNRCRDPRSSYRNLVP